VANNTLRKWERQSLMNLKMDSFEDALDRLDFDWGVDYD